MSILTLVHSSHPFCQCQWISDVLDTLNTHILHVSPLTIIKAHLWSKFRRCTASAHSSYYHNGNGRKFEACYPAFRSQHRLERSSTACSRFNLRPGARGCNACALSRVETGCCCSPSHHSNYPGIQLNRLMAPMTQTLYRQSRKTKKHTNDLVTIQRRLSSLFGARIKRQNPQRNGYLQICKRSW